MKNQQILQLIENLKSRRNYEEIKAPKLGFTSLYNYFEDKIVKERKVIEDKKIESKEIKTSNKIENKKNKSCSCC